MRSLERLEAYEQRTSATMVALAVAYFVIYTAQVLWHPMPEPFTSLFSVAAFGIWAVFIADLSIRTWLAPRRIRYLAQHPLDLIAVIIPMFRAL